MSLCFLLALFRSLFVCVLCLLVVFFCLFVVILSLFWVVSYVFVGILSLFFLSLWSCVVSFLFTSAKEVRFMLVWYLVGLDKNYWMYHHETRWKDAVWVRGETITFWCRSGSWGRTILFHLLSCEMENGWFLREEFMDLDEKTPNMFRGLIFLIIYNLGSSP